MPKLTAAQKIYFAIILVVALPWAGLLVGVPVAEYLYGASKLTVLLSKIASVLQVLLIALVVIVSVLQRTGILPTVKSDLPAYQSTPVVRLRNLAIWIVVALLLVFVFNLQQGSKIDAGLTNLLIEYFPIALLLGVWIFIMFRMSQKKKRDLQPPS